MPPVAARPRIASVAVPRTGAAFAGPRAAGRRRRDGIPGAACYDRRFHGAATGPFDPRPCVAASPCRLRFRERPVTDSAVSSINDSITVRRLACGATLVVEEIPSAASVATEWMLPGGTAFDEERLDGLAGITAEMVLRGAGDLDSRALSDAFDRIGFRRWSRAGTYTTKVGGVLLADRLDEGWPLLVDMIRRPRLPEDALEPVRSLARQSLAGLQDDPQHEVMLRLRERHGRPPYHRHGYGTESGLAAITIDDVRGTWAARAVPERAIIAVAGRVVADDVARDLDRLLDGWSGDAAPEPAKRDAARGTEHLARDSAQVHVGIALDAPPAADEHSILERLGIRVLGGSTSGRLFTEVRQKRSLCYSVGASYGAGRDEGTITIYAGTTPERANETLEVCLAEIDRLRQGVERDEFDRAVIGLRSRLVMQGESTGARAGSLAGDQFTLGRPRSLEERLDEVARVTEDDLAGWLAARPAAEPTIVTIGPVAVGAAG